MNPSNPLAPTTKTKISTIRKLLTLLALVAIVALSAFLAYFYFVPTARDEPIQTTTSSRAIHVGNATLTPQATYDITARVLGIKSYESQPQHDGDLIPFDLALGWGSMSSNYFAAQVGVSFQATSSVRSAVFSYSDRISLGSEYVDSHTSNNHIIPSTPAILSQIRNLRRGHTIRLTGYLVDIQRTNGTTIKTSLSRTDTIGGQRGACEIIYVETFERL